MIDHCQVNPFISVSSQELSMSSKYDCDFDTLLFKLGSWKSTYNSGLVYFGDLLHKKWHQN